MSWLILNMISNISAFWAREDGNAAEYGLLIGLIAIAIVAGAGLLGTGLNTLFNALGTYFNGLSVALPTPA